MSGSATSRSAPVDVLVVLDEADRLRRHRERADGLVVAGVPDVEDRVALLGPDLASWCTLVTSGHTALTTKRSFDLRRGDDLGRGAVGREHERRTRRDVVDVVHEDHARARSKRSTIEPVVDDLVVAVHGCGEDPHHPRERLDRHLDTGAEAPWLGEQDLANGHRPRLTPGLLDS